MLARAGRYLLLLWIINPAIPLLHPLHAHPTALVHPSVDIDVEPLRQVRGVQPPELILHAAHHALEDHAVAVSSVEDVGE